MTDRPRVTVAIPLHRSAAFVDNVLACIRAMPETGVEILVSDRHLADDALDRIARATVGDPRVRCLAERDGLDWVSHINHLVRTAQGDFWRLSPHDDYVPPGSLESLLDAMEHDPDLLVAYPATYAETLEGERLPNLDVTKPHPESTDRWTYDHFLNLYRGGYFQGAFKGLVRLAPVRQHNLYIRPNVGLIDSERLWLFGLALAGRFRFVPDSTYVKRYHDTSTHRQWRRRPLHGLGAIWVMNAYVRALHPPGRTRRLVLIHLLLNNLPQVKGLSSRWISPFPWPLNDRRLRHIPLVGWRLLRLADRLVELQDQTYACAGSRP